MKSPPIPPNSPYFARNQDGQWDFVIGNTRRSLEAPIDPLYRDLIACAARVGWIEIAELANIDVPISAGAVTVASMIAWDNFHLWKEWSESPRLTYEAYSFALVPI